MKIIKKSNESVAKQDAHGGSGSRKLYADANEIKNVQGVTYGWLPVGNKYAYHNHEGINEMMICLEVWGVVRDDDGEYPFAPGDFFIFPKEVFHEIENTGKTEAEFVFVRTFEK